MAQLTNPVTNSLTKLDFQVNLDVDVDFFPQIMRCLKIAHRESSPAPQFLNNFLLAEREPQSKGFHCRSLSFDDSPTRSRILKPPSISDSDPGGKSFIRMKQNIAKIFARCNQNDFKSICKTEEMLKE